MKNSSLFQKSNNKEKHFLKRETKRLEHIITSLSLSLFVRSKRTFFGRKRENFKRKERERGKREREFLRSFFFSERERERERISILKSRDFLPFELTLALNTRVHHISKSSDL